jgi:hypothetical protein
MADCNKMFLPLGSDENKVKYPAKPRASEQEALWYAGSIVPCVASQAKRKLVNYGGEEE